MGTRYEMTAVVRPQMQNEKWGNVSTVGDLTCYLKVPPVGDLTCNLKVPPVGDQV